MKYRCSFYFSLRQCRLRKQNIQQRLKQNTKEERILDIFKQDHEVFLKNKNECVYWICFILLQVIGCKDVLLKWMN